MSAPLTAVLDKLGGDAARTYKLNGVPEKPEYPYREVTVGWADAFAYTMAGGHTGTHRAVVRSFSRTLDGALEFDQDARDQLDEVFLTAPGWECGALRLELASAINRDPDDHGVVTVTTSFTFTATKEP